MLQATGRHRGGFTLTELLVTLSIIALLIGLLAPALNEVRVKARTVACVSKSSQNAKAWISYVADHQFFPAPEIPLRDDGVRDIRLMRRSWGGVDWYSDDDHDDLRGVLPSKRRPLNPYLSMNDRQTAGGDATRCPAERGLSFGSLDFQDFDTMIEPFSPGIEGSNYQWAARSSAPDGGTTAHGIFGTSYGANDWCWVTRNAPWGLNASVEEEVDLWFTTRNGPEDVESPSRFVLLQETLNFRNAAGGGRNLGILGHRIGEHRFEHGDRRCTLAFLDGSAGNFWVDFNDHNTDRWTIFSYPRRSAKYPASSWGFQRGNPLPDEAIAQLGRR